LRAREVLVSELALRADKVLAELGLEVQVEEAVVMLRTDAIHGGVLHLGGEDEFEKVFELLDLSWALLNCCLCGRVRLRASGSS
jgi:hypothetical protein